MMSSNNMSSRENNKAVNKMKKAVNNVILVIILFVVTVGMVIPFVWMISASFKYNTEIFEYPIRWVPKVFHWSNYREVWTKIHFITYYLNTFKLAVIITLAQLVTCSLAAYAFAKLRFPHRDKIFLVYLGTMMVPWQAIMIPQFIVVKSLGLYNSLGSIVILQAFSVFGVFILKQFMLGLPMELSDSARIDGCNEFQTYYKIILPMSKHGLATLTIFTFTYVWNDYLCPLIYLSDDKIKTIQLGLTSFRTLYSMDYGPIMAGTVCSLVPVIILYALAQSYLIEGIAFTGLKA